jgi:hypothetical protein
LKPALLLHWHYLIFLAPFGVAAMMLLLSSLRLGHRHGHRPGPAHSSAHPASATHGHGAHSGVRMGGGARSAGGAARSGPAHAGHKVSGAHRAPPSRHTSATRNGADRGAGPHSGLLLLALGSRRAPLPMVLEAFFMIWGLSGCLTLQLLLRDNSAPTLGQVLPVMGIAAGCGVVGARIASELIARFMPDEETSVVSREGLYGLKGRVAFPVNTSTGRILVYDDFGSLHDERCRVAEGHPPIDRGSQAIILDRDSRGCLIVEEVPD